jgi:hypothetical protein
MSISEKEKRPRSSSLARVIRLLQNPIQFRVVSTLALLGIWYGAFAMPLIAEIDDVTKRITRESSRIVLATEVERLRDQVSRFNSRLPKDTDPNEWIHYMLEGVRQFPRLEVKQIDPDGFKDVGPLKGVVMKLEVEGNFTDLDAFLRWVEGNPRLFRVSYLKMEPPRSVQARMTAQMIIIGLMG